jgi:hypothetical protein
MFFIFVWMCFVEHVYTSTNATTPTRFQTYCPCLVTLQSNMCIARRNSKPLMFWRGTRCHQKRNQGRLSHYLGWFLCQLLDLHWRQISWKWNRHSMEDKGREIKFFIFPPPPDTKWLQKATLWFPLGSKHYSNRRIKCAFRNFWCQRRWVDYFIFPIGVLLCF